MVKHLIGSALLAAALCACSKSGGDVDKFMKLDSDKAVAFNAGGQDCVAKAKSVGDWRKAHSAEYKALQKKLNDEWPSGPPKDVQDKYGKKMQENKKAVINAMMDCTNNEAFDKMMDDTASSD